MKKLIYFIRKNFFLLILAIGIILISAININLRLKLNEYSGVKSISTLGKTDMAVDSLEGLTVTEDLIFSIEKNKVKSTYNVHKPMLIFTKPNRACGSCLSSIISLWFKQTQEYKTGISLKPLIFLEKNDEELKGFLEAKDLIKKVKLKIDDGIVNNFTPRHTQGVCLFINMEGKILFAEELRLENTEQIKRTFQKIIHYLNNTTLNENNQISVLFESTVAH